MHVAGHGLKHKSPALGRAWQLDWQGAVVLGGGHAYEVPGERVAKVVDTTGAGDLFAAGFLFGHARGWAVGDCLTMGAICAAEIISHYGARPEADLKALVATRFG